MSPMRRIAALLVLLTACETSGWELVEVTDEGSVCLEAATADTDGTVTVTMDGCLSSSCDRNAEGTCEATLDGTTIEVHSAFSYETATGDVECTTDCGYLEAECTVGPLPAGTYTVVHGAGTETFEVPTEEACEPW